MQTISVKNLRQKFPFVRSELEKGESFLIIHKSRPIAKLEPFATNRVQEIDEEMKEWERASLEDINKHLPDTTKEEYDYYMSKMKPL